MLIFAFVLRANLLLLLLSFFISSSLIYLASEPNRSAVAVAAATMANCKLSQAHVENWNRKSKAAKEQHKYLRLREGERQNERGRKTERETEREGGILKAANRKKMGTAARILGHNSI